MKPQPKKIKFKSQKSLHKARHIKLHQYLDELVADFITHTKQLPSATSVFELMQWSHSQTKSPSERVR